MVWEQVYGAILSAVAGVTMSLTTALLAEHREKRQWLRRKVYQPLYGELTDAISGDIPTGERGYRSLWAGFDYYKTHRVDSELAEALDDYASDVNELSGHEHEADLTAFVDALPGYVRGEDTVEAELPSGRRVDMRTWLKRNLVVLSTHPSLREQAFGFEPADLDYLWAEVDGMSADGTEGEPFDTAQALTIVSREFNWGYEVFYHQWDDDWAEAFAEALVETMHLSDVGVQKALVLRRDIGRSASTLKRMIHGRTERRLHQSLRDHWTGNWIR